MTPEGLFDLVVATGRLSAALFVVALLGAGAGYRRALQLWGAFAGAHAIHFSMVAWLAFVSDGANLRDIGGWPAALGIGAGFYILVACAALAWSGIGGRAVRGIGHLGVVLIALAFIATYVPLLAVSASFALPVAGLVGALGFYLTRAIRGSPGTSS